MTHPLNSSDAIITTSIFKNIFEIFCRPIFKTINRNICFQGLTHTSRGTWVWKLLLFYWLPVRVVCQNYEVMMFQPWTGTLPELCSIDTCYVAVLFKPTPTFFRSQTDVCLGGASYPLMSLPSFPFRLTCLHIGSFPHRGVTCLCPRILSSIAPCIKILHPPASSALAMPSGFPTLRPCCRQNLF